MKLIFDFFDKIVGVKSVWFKLLSLALIGAVMIGVGWLFNWIIGDEESSLHILTWLAVASVGGFLFFKLYKYLNNNYN